MTKPLGGGYRYKIQKKEKGSKTFDLYKSGAAEYGTTQIFNFVGMDQHEGMTVRFIMLNKLQVAGSPADVVVDMSGGELVLFKVIVELMYLNKHN